MNVLNKLMIIKTSIYIYIHYNVICGYNGYQIRNKRHLKMASLILSKRHVNQRSKHETNSEKTHAIATIPENTKLNITYIAYKKCNKILLLLLSLFKHIAK